MFLSFRFCLTVCFKLLLFRRYQCMRTAWFWSRCLIRNRETKEVFSSFYIQEKTCEWLIGKLIFREKMDGETSCTTVRAEMERQTSCTTALNVIKSAKRCNHLSWLNNFMLMPTNRLTSVCLLHLKIRRHRSRSPKWLIDWFQWYRMSKVFLCRCGQKGIEASRTTAAYWTRSHASHSESKVANVLRGRGEQFGVETCRQRLSSRTSTWRWNKRRYRITVHLVAIAINTANCSSYVPIKDK